MKEITNRSAIIVYPRKPYIEWARTYNESPVETLEQRLNEKHVYLIDWSYEEEIIDALAPYYQKIFEYELLIWNSYKNEWPQTRTYETFIEWFDVTLCDEIVDMAVDKIALEKL